jgi:high-affinity Fe2+/Pb2+ permease
MQPVTPGEPTIGKLVTDASRDISTLISQEIKLAKSELKVSVTTGGVGAGLLVGAALVGFIVIILLSMTAAYFFPWGGSGLALHWAFLIVTVFYLIVAGVLGFVGLKRLKKVRGPERAIAQAQETKTALTQRGASGAAVALEKR